MKQHTLILFGQAGTASALPQARIDYRLIENCEHRMKKVTQIIEEQDEPIGIIISRGDRAEQRPVFSAYIWGPAPEPVTDTATKVA